jgi:hypothetical protein
VTAPLNSTAGGASRTAVVAVVQGNVPRAGLDFNSERERVLRFFRMSPNRPVLIAGSTLRGEEEAVIRAFNEDKPYDRFLREQPPQLTHEERARIAALCKRRGLVPSSTVPAPVRDAITTGILDASSYMIPATPGGT